MIDSSAIRIYPYGLAVAGAVLIGLFWARALCARRGLAAQTVSVFAVFGLPLSFLFARLLYCLICLEGFSRRGIAYFFDFTGGGYTLFGALLGGVLALALTARRTRQSWGRIADALCAPAALVIALARLAEGLVGQGYGWYVEDWFDPMNGMSLFHPQEFDGLLRFPFAVQDMYGEWSWAIFVLEALLALVIALHALRRGEGECSGDTALRALLDLCAAQILCESLRQDAVLRFGFVRVSQVLGALVAVALLVYGCVRMEKTRPVRLLAPILGTLASVGVVVAMEFALEKKIVWLEAWPMDVCYLLTALACLALVKSVGAALRAPQQAAKPMTGTREEGTR